MELVVQTVVLMGLGWASTTAFKKLPWCQQKGILNCQALQSSTLLAVRTRMPPST